MLTWLAQQSTPAPAYHPSGFVGLAEALLCCGAPSFPVRAPQDGKETHLEAPTPDPLTRQ